MMFRVSIGEYVVECQSEGLLPSLIKDYCDHAAVAERFGMAESGGTVCFLSVGKPLEWPFLVVVQRYSPGPNGGFYPGVLIIPETDTLLLGAGERLLAFNLATPSLLWEDTADTGFWCWSRHGDTVIMSAELECAAWDLHARKLWSTFVEPPWEYSVSGATMNLDVMGRESSFPLRKGPQ